MLVLHVQRVTCLHRADIHKLGNQLLENINEIKSQRVAFDDDGKNMKKKEREICLLFFVILDVANVSITVQKCPLLKIQVVLQRQQLGSAITT